MDEGVALAADERTGTEIGGAPSAVAVEFGSNGHGTD